MQWLAGRVEYITRCSVEAAEY